MSTLVSEGLLERIPGSGTYVRALAELPIKREAPTAAEKRIGLLLSYPSSELDLDILIGIEHAVKSRGYQITFAYTEESAEQQTRDINRLRAGQVSGLIVYPLSDIGYDESIWRLHADGIPFVLIDRYFPDLDTDYVVSDNLGGGYRATEHLIILGHTRIGFAYGPAGLNTTSVRDRFEGYRKALDAYGMPYDEALVYAATTINSNYSRQALEDYLRRADRPPAIFASTDHLVSDLLRTAQRIGLRVPDDLALVGFDNLRFTSQVHPPVTTIAQPGRDEGIRAVNLLINRIEGQDGPPQHIELPTSLIIRESCGARLRVGKLANSAVQEK